jgi:hypothetical protein
MKTFLIAAIALMALTGCGGGGGGGSSTPPPPIPSISGVSPSTVSNSTPSTFTVSGAFGPINCTSQGCANILELWQDGKEVVAISFATFGNTQATVNYTGESADNTPIPKGTYDLRWEYDDINGKTQTFSPITTADQITFD